MLSLTHDRATTMAEALKSSADAIRDGFGLLTAAEATSSYQIPYPENILTTTKSDLPADELGGFT